MSANCGGWLAPSSIGTARLPTPEPFGRASLPPGQEADQRREALELLVERLDVAGTRGVVHAHTAYPDGYAAVGAALGAADSPLHIAAATRTSRLLTQVRRGREPERALADAVQDGNGIPGFGHPLYSGVDDRADALFPLLAQLPDGEGTMDAVTRLSDTVAARAHARPNVDLALAALASGARLPDDAASSIFVVGRLAGWIAHIGAEYAEAPMRLRPRGEYVGP